MKLWNCGCALLGFFLLPDVSSADTNRLLGQSVTHGWDKCAWNDVAAIGGAGHGNGEFDHPQGITHIDLDFFVADTGNNRIQRWSFSSSKANWSFERAWGDAGTGNGSFDAPTDVAGHNYDKLYVVDSGNNRIQVFTPEGVFLSAWGGAGSLPGQFLNPHSVAVDNANSTVFVTDRGNYRIQKFSLDGQYLGSWGSQGSENGEFQEPMSIAVAENEVFVVDRTLGRVQVFTLDGEFQRTIGSPGSGDGQLSSPVGISGGSSFIWVSDAGNNRLALFATDGTWICSQSGFAMSDYDGLGPGIWDSYGVCEASSQLVRFTIFDPVKPTTWGGIKALYEPTRGGQQ